MTNYFKKKKKENLRNTINFISFIFESFSDRCSQHMLFQTVDEVWVWEHPLSVPRDPRAPCAQWFVCRLWGFKGLWGYPLLFSKPATVHHSRGGVFPVGPACYARVCTVVWFHTKMSNEVSFVICLATNTDEKEIQPQLSLCTCRRNRSKTS